MELWQFIGLLTGFFAACAAAGKILLDQSQRHLDERFATQETTRGKDQEQLEKRLDGIEKVNREEKVEWQRVEREMLRFHADMPMKYVMRDDYIRNQTLIEAKLDGLAAKIDNSNLRAQLGERK